MNIIRKTTRVYLARAFAFIMIIVLCTTTFQAPASALDACQRRIFNNNIGYFNCAEDDAACSVGAVQGVGTGDIPSGYVVPQDILDDVARHLPTYQKISAETGVPAMLFAVLHYREASFGTTWPDNGQGIYQFYPRTDFPKNRPATAAEFEEQTRLVFTSKLIGKMEIAAAKMNELGIPPPTVDPKDPASVGAALTDAKFLKAVMFGYNGWAKVYADQAEALDYIKQPWEGSPYVMNLYDAARNGRKATNPAKWRQILVDGGGLDKVNNAVGAYTLYVALGGNAVNGATCGGGVGGGLQAVVAVAQKEFADHKNFNEGGCNCGDPVYKYTANNAYAWCASFVSWVFKEAGMPFKPQWQIAGVLAMQAWFQHTDGAEYFEVGSKPPQPGDVAFYIGAQTPDRDSGQHVNIVISVDVAAGTMVTIGGNESNAIKQTTREIKLGANNLVGFGRRTR